MPLTATPKTKTHQATFKHTENCSRRNPPHTHQANHVKHKESDCLSIQVSVFLGKVSSQLRFARRSTATAFNRAGIADQLVELLRVSVQRTAAEKRALAVGVSALKKAKR